MSKIRPIAFYLPQFYPTPENDEWWGKGFTEWTNVARAKKLYPGHYQPRIPADLGFYDLRIPSVREEQANLARKAGVEGFCYWHYWFAGRRLLDKVFTEVVESGKPDFPFCLCWANHSWSQKTWDQTKPNKLLIEQTYPGREDYIAHFNALLPAFRDERYIRHNGKLLFGVYEPTWVPDTQLFFDTWNEQAEKHGLGGFHFFGFMQGRDKMPACSGLNYDSIVYDCMMDAWSDRPGETKIQELIGRAKRKFLKYPMTVDYNSYATMAETFYSKRADLIPCIDPDFDHSPRSGGSWLIVDGSTPERWGQLVANVRSTLESRNDELLFIKAWNEWGEGNYLEPDLKWGTGYLDEMGKALSYDARS